MSLMDVLDSILLKGISLARAVELTVQWEGILRNGAVYLVNEEDLLAACSRDLELFRDTAGLLHRRLSDFIHRVVVHRRDDAVGGWKMWIREDPLVHPYKWLRPDMVPPAPFLQCKPHLTAGGSAVLADPACVS